MELLSFRIQNYRSIEDSGEIRVDDQTALVGRNESGKTNLLLALRSLNPPDEVKSLDPVKNFPRARRLEEQSESTPVVWTKWRLDESEIEKLNRKFPRTKESVNTVVIERDYGGNRNVKFEGLPALSVDRQELDDVLLSLVSSLRRSTSKLTEEKKQDVMSSLDLFTDTVETFSTVHPTKWATETLSALDNFRDTISDCENLLTDNAKGFIGKIEKHALRLERDADRHQESQSWVVDQLPVFIYLDDYPELEGHQDIKKFVKRTKKNKLSQADENFAKLLKVAGLDAAKLHKLLSEDHEKRQQLANRAGAVVTKKLQELWTDRDLKVRFNLDERHFDTVVSDSEHFYDVEVNLNERSRGFRWFFSFYITFAADTKGGEAEDAILLLDEPGLHLHAVAQRDLLNHFEQDFENQIIYTTHSPFLIPPDELRAVRTVNISIEQGTTVTNEPTGDRKTLFPLQTALGYDLSQHLFVGTQNLVVEGVSDYWYLQTVSSYLNEEYGTGLEDEIVITPAGGAPRVPYLVTLLSSQKLDVVVLLDEEEKARRIAREKLVQKELIREDNVLFISDAFDKEVAWADVEDMFPADAYDTLVRESCSSFLEPEDLDVNQKIPRLTKRYEEAFSDLDEDFFHTTPARHFLQRFPEEPERFLRDDSRERFESLFRKIEDKFYKSENEAGAFV